MASRRESVLGNFNLLSFSKAKELKKRLLFTLGALMVYRIGTYIPLPGINPHALIQIFSKQSGIVGMFDLFTGGALSRMSIFALNIMPYISASIIMQLLVAVLPALNELKKEGDSGQIRINQYTRYATVVLALIQGYGIAFGLEGLHSNGYIPAVINPGWAFRIQTAIAITAGAMFLVWLGEQITGRGIGNGTSLIIFSGIVASLPGSLASILQMGRVGSLSTVVIIGLLVLIIVLIIFIVFMERAQRRIIIQYPKRQIGHKITGGESTHLPLKLNTSGVIPPIFASSLLLLPVTLANFNRTHHSHAWLDVIITYLGQGKPLFLLLYVTFIIFFSFFYTSVVFNSEETADHLKKNGGFVPGIRPGKNTAEYFDYILTRLTVIGSMYLAFVCVLPQILIAQYAIPFHVGGTGLLIVVAVTLDTVVQIQSHLFAHQYDSLIKKSSLYKRKKK